MIKDTYKIEIAMSTTISAKVVEDIIKREIEEQTGRTIVKFNYNYDGSKFDGFHITFAPETSSSAAYKSSKTFIEQKWK